jgi:carbonic anhydrase
MNTPDAILERLAAGNERFVADRVDGKLQDSQRREALTSGQEPYAIVLGCADSRVVPELAFDTGVGELFVVRVAGNIATTETIASIEYAVAHLGTSVIVVLGHQSCGAVSAAIAGGDNGHNLNQLLAHIAPACTAVPGGSVDDVVKKNAALTVAALTERSPILRDAVAAEKLRIVPAFYALDSGKVSFETTAQ